MTSLRFGGHTRDSVTEAITGQSVLTLLDTRVLAEAASYVEDWRTARSSNDAIAQKVGRRYHVQSYRRSKRKLVQLGFLESRRVLTGEPLPDAAKKQSGSEYGTTVKRVLWIKLGLTHRKVRAVRRAQRVSQAELQRREEQAQRARAKGREPAPPAPIRQLTGGNVDPGLAAILARGAAMIPRVLADS